MLETFFTSELGCGSESRRTRFVSGSSIWNREGQRLDARTAVRRRGRSGGRTNLTEILPELPLGAYRVAVVQPYSSSVMDHCKGRPRRPPADESFPVGPVHVGCAKRFARADGRGGPQRANAASAVRVRPQKGDSHGRGAGADLRMDESGKETPARRGDQKRAFFREPLSAFAVTAAARGDGYTPNWRK